MFGHEKFEAYQLAVEFLKIALPLNDQIPRGNASLKDQFKRAAMSISLNIAEGSGKIRSADRKNFYAIARGSAMECAAICDVVALTDRELQDEVNRAKDLLRSIVAILSKICLQKG